MFRTSHYYHQDEDSDYSDDDLPSMPVLDNDYSSEEDECTTAPPEEEKKPIVPKRRSNKKSMEDIQFKIPGHTLICGSTGSGKTCILRYYMKLNRKKFKRVYAIAGASEFNNDYDFLKPECILNPQDDFLLQRLGLIVKAQEKLIKSGYKSHLCLIFDDIISLLNTYSGPQGKLILFLVTQGRHRNIQIIFLTQRISKLSPTIRDNCMYWIVSKVPRNSIMDYCMDYQTKYTNKFKFWDAYKNNTKERYSSMLLQQVDPYQDSIIWLNPVPLC